MKDILVSNVNDQSKYMKNPRAATIEIIYRQVCKILV